MKNTLIGIIVLAIIIIAGWKLLSKPDTTNTPAEGGSTSAPHETLNPNGAAAGVSDATTTPAATPSGITMAQVATHNSKSSCWAAIRGSVYDLTGWINQHPGGSAQILSICGKDGTTAFNTQHDSQPKPNNQLDNFRIGALAI